MYSVRTNNPNRKCRATYSNEYTDRNKYLAVSRFHCQIDYSTAVPSRLSETVINPGEVEPRWSGGKLIDAAVKSCCWIWGHTVDLSSSVVSCRIGAMIALRRINGEVEKLPWIGE